MTEKENPKPTLAEKILVVGRRTGKNHLTSEAVYGALDAAVARNLEGVILPPQSPTPSGTLTEAQQDELLAKHPLVTAELIEEADNLKVNSWFAHLYNQEKPSRVFRPPDELLDETFRLDRIKVTPVIRTMSDASIQARLKEMQAEVDRHLEKSVGKFDHQELMDMVDSRLRALGSTFKSFELGEPATYTRHVILRQERKPNHKRTYTAVAWRSDNSNDSMVVKGGSWRKAKRKLNAYIKTSKNKLLIDLKIQPLVPVDYVQLKSLVQSTPHADWN